MQPLQRDAAGSNEPDAPAVHPVPSDRDTVVPDRLGPTEDNGADVAPATLHVALVIGSLDDWAKIKDTAYIVSPPYWKGEVRLHVLLQNPRKDRTEMLYKLALVDLGLVDPEVAELTPDLGWPTDRDA